VLLASTANILGDPRVQRTVTAPQDVDEPLVAGLLRRARHFDVAPSIIVMLATSFSGKQAIFLAIAANFSSFGPAA
jgi:hypothetical protein